jgi:hypothetical protein
MTTRHLRQLRPQRLDPVVKEVGRLLCQQCLIFWNCVPSLGCGPDSLTKSFYID